jgi:hypothetical protein
MKLHWLGWKYGLLAIGLVTLTFLVMDFNNRMTELRRLNGKQEEVAAEATNLMKTQVYLKTEIAFATSEGAVSQWAYEDGHWVKVGDVLVVPVEQGGATPVPTPAPTPTMLPETNRQVWLSLFFDKSSYIKPSSP